MELRQLSTFAAVARTLSFTRAAEELDYAQSSVTAQMQALEAELGAPLFERLGKRITLTEAGTRLVPYAERMLGLAIEARAVVGGGEEPTGTLSVGSPESLCVYRLLPVLSRFRARFPRVQVVFRPGLYTDLRRDLTDGRIDVCFLLEPPLSLPGLYIELLVEEPLLVLAQPDHPLVRRAAVAPRDLAGESLLLTEAGCSYRAPFEQTLTEVGVHLGAILEFGSVEAIKQCVMAGMGLTFLPAIAVRSELAQGRLAALAWTGEDYGLVTQMAWHRDKWLSPALRAFIELSRELLATPRSVSA